MSEETLGVYEVPPAEAGRTVLSVLGDLLPDVRTADLRALCTYKGVTCEGTPLGAGQHLEAGQVLEYELEDLPRIPPKGLPGWELLRLSDEVLACFKPAGVATEGDRADELTAQEASLRGAVLQALIRAGRAPLPRPRFVHRLDKDTSGVLLVALSHASMRRLTAQLAGEAEPKVVKRYLALVEGRLLEAEGEIEAPLKVEGGRRKAPVGVDEEGKLAKTRFERVEALGPFTLVRLWPETGRTHQLRVHMAHLGHPIVCDRHYGSKEPLLLSKLKRSYRPGKKAERPLLERLALHAEAIRFEDQGESVEVEAPLPKDLSVALKQLRKLFA